MVTVPGDRAARIVTLVALADEAPTAAELAPYLEDPDADVRRTAVSVLTESAPADAAVALARRLLDGDAAVRRSATEGLRELREVVHVDEDLRAALAAATVSSDAGVRAAVVRLRREHRVLPRDEALALAGDGDGAVRREVVAALVALDAVADLADRAGLAGDADALVRLEVARGLGSLGDPSGAPALLGLADDGDVRVAAAAVEALGRVGLGESGEDRARQALTATAWEVRKAAATALGHGADGTAADALLAAAADTHADVRRAAVQSLARWVPTRADVRAALAAAVTDDPDADVRGYARLALG
jgi:HEAT repeat protein